MPEAVDILNDQIRELKDQLKDANKKLGDFETDNKKQRDELRDLKAENEALGAQVPAEGSVVLSKADAQRWELAKEAAEASGGFDKLKALPVSLSAAQNELAKRDRHQSMADAGFAPGKLERLLPEGARFALDGEGDDAKAVLRVTEGEEEKVLELEAWAESENISDLLNAARSGKEPEVKREVKVLQQVGGRQTKSRLADADEVYAQKQRDSRYRM